VLQALAALQQQQRLQAAKQCTCSRNCSSSNPSMCCHLQQQALAAAAQADTAHALQRTRWQTQQQLLLLLQCHLECCSSCKRS
jgi:hypothetical protein